MKKVTVIGVGALGSHFVLFARNFAELKGIDDGRVKSKSPLAQFHSKPQVDRSKTQGIQQTMQFLFGVKVAGVPHRLTADNTEQLLGGADLLVDCLDNAPSRELVQAFVRSSGTPCLHGALAANGQFGRVVWDENFVIDGAVPGAVTCEDAEHLPFISVVSALLSRAAQEFLGTGRKIGFEVHPTGVNRT
jgi:molybdopterin/thiamine biosynthesis adenylyltransferase